VAGDSAVDVVKGLNNDERTVLEELPRIPKSDRKNTFHEARVQRRKRCFEIVVAEVLKSLGNKGLVYSVGGGRWRTTALGRKVSHALLDDMLSKKYPSLTIRK